MSIIMKLSYTKEHYFKLVFLPFVFIYDVNVVVCIRFYNSYHIVEISIRGVFLRPVITPSSVKGSGLFDNATRVLCTGATLTKHNLS